MKKTNILLSIIIVILLFFGYFFIVKPNVDRNNHIKASKLKEAYEALYIEHENIQNHLNAIANEKGQAYKDLAEVYKRLLDQKKKSMDSIASIITY